LPIIAIDKADLQNASAFFALISFHLSFSNRNEKQAVSGAASAIISHLKKMREHDVIEGCLLERYFQQKVFI